MPVERTKSGPPKRKLKCVRKPGVNPKIYGPIPGIPVFSTFTSRHECSKAGVHAHTLKGIHGTKDGPAYSIVMSGRYEDNSDKGDAFVYTGEGGRLTVLPGGKKTRSGPQVKDQEWVGGNKSLQLSQISGNPVRVVRGHRLNSRYAPVEGYRYDGLYQVTEATRAVGKTGFVTCQFTFERLPGQPPLPNEVLRPAKVPARRRCKSSPTSTADISQTEDASSEPSELKPLRSLKREQSEEF
ncbi:PUA-like domain-containing protein [Mycena maculata]|uniref:PUA-like domain-containing protein n=1 Tax=Mycena maculata TaxID=230809 RepID=A0AAD7MQD6_9AGAR|nr:PUA-like domain-containing protein [Mycena maculata]